MKARVIDATISPLFEGIEGVVVLTLDYTEFTAHNARFESANYYDARQNPTLTARQAGYYKPQERLHFAASDAVANWLSVADAATMALHTRHQTSGSTLSYVSWLEAMVIAAG